MIIYKIENKINGKIYIGQTIKSLSRRIGHHLQAKKQCVVDKALHKYGIESFIISIIDTAETRAVLHEKEKYWIKFYDCRGPKGYNCTDGGEGTEGCKHTPEEIEKMRKAQKGRVHSPEHIRNAGIGRRGVPLSEETKRRMSAARQGMKLSEQVKRNMSIAKSGVNNPNYGRGRKFMDNIYPLFKDAVNA